MRGEELRIRGALRVNSKLWAGIKSRWGSRLFDGVLIIISNYLLGFSLLKDATQRFTQN